MSANRETLSSRTKAQAVRELLGAAPSLVGVGLGPKLVAGRPVEEACVRLYVARKLPAAALAPSARLPARVGELRTDVVEIGPVVTRPARPGLDGQEAPPVAAPARTVDGPPPRERLRVRPVRPGCSIGWEEPMAGTVGAVVRDRDGTQHLLSCSHVLADEGRLAVGAAIVQPALLDQGPLCHEPTVAHLVRAVPMGRGGHRVDAAIARGLHSLALDPTPLAALGRFRLPVAAAHVGQSVTKVGRSTGRTVGRVVDDAVDLNVGYARGVLRFVDQILIAGDDDAPLFSAPGDSGALIVEERSRRPVGLLFGGSPSHTVANPIDAVLAALDVELCA